MSAQFWVCPACGRVTAGPCPEHARPGAPQTIDLVCIEGVYRTPRDWLDALMDEDPDFDWSKGDG